MTLDEAKNFLRDIGRPTCSCKYGSQDNLIQEAIRLKKIEEEKTHN